MERARGTADANKCLAALSVQYSNAINLAKPVSIQKLRASAARRNAGLASSARELVTASVAVVLIFFAVLGFVIVQDINDNMVELQRINLQNPLQKLTELRRMIHEGALKDPKLAYYSQYLKAQNELALMFDNANQILKRTEASMRRRTRIDSSGDSENDDDTGLVSQMYNIILFALVGPAAPPPDPGVDKLAGAHVRAAVGPQPVSMAAPGALKAAPRLNAASSPASDPDFQSKLGGTLEGLYKPVPTIGPENCKPYNNTPVKTLVGENNSQFLMAALDKFDDYCLAQTLDIRSGSYHPAVAIHTVRVLQNQLFIIGVLFLPMIGGLLGATISLIYAIINDTSGSRISASYMFLRIVVGGAFGVIIGWFSSTGSASSQDFAQHVSGTPFTLAILAGFSIETLSIVLQKFSKASAEQAPKPKG